MAHSRREFLCDCIAAVGATALAFNKFGLINALAQGGDYKALVCVFLNGGNDSDNVIIPVTNYADYAAVRTPSGGGGNGLQIPIESLLQINPGEAGTVYGLHPSLTGMKSIWDEGRLAAIVNCGPLTRPLTRDEYRNNPSLRPRNLFSHSDQQSLWQTSLADQTSPTGWGGRLADKTRHLNPPDIRFPMMITVTGVTVFTAGDTERSLQLPPGAQFRFEGLAEGGPQYEAMRQLTRIDREATLIRSASVTLEQAIENARELTSLPPVGTFPNTTLGNQLRQVAQLIKLNRTSPTLGLNRQLFFCQLGGFDTHSGQVVAGNPTGGTHASLWAQVSNAMKAFYDEMQAQGISSNVTTFTLSDFARTFRPNGNLGTDHAWGSHQFVMGGAVNGANFYGTYQTLAPDGPDDADVGGGARGRWIPTTAVDQYGATLATWFGVPAVDLPVVFPYLDRFAAPNLGFMST
jgi:uncharacterized protein (DUF1501 family)